MMLFVLIAGYLIGLLTFYTFAVFDTQAWDVSYFAWAKGMDASVLAWGVIYKMGNRTQKEYVKSILLFSVVRFLFDIQSAFTGIKVNNTTIVAVLFLILVCLISYLTLFVEGKLSKWISKQLRI